MRLKVAGFIINARLTDREEKSVFLPLLNYIAKKKKSIKNKRFLLGISGIPAGGKTVFSEFLKRYINSHRRFGLNAQTVYLDGFHLPQEILRKRKIKSVDGSLIPLMRRKGSPWTYDVRRAKRVFKELKDKERLSLPEYDRNLHEPVEGRVKIKPEDNIIIVEGNYLFYEKGAWKGMKNIFHIRLFIDVPQDACRPKIIARHVRGGMTLKQAKGKYAENDYPNTRIIAATKKNADIVLKKNMRQRYTGLIVKGM